MQLLVAMEQSQAGIVGHKVDFNFLISPSMTTSFSMPAVDFPAIGSIQAMPMQMDRMYIVTGVAHA